MKSRKLKKTQYKDLLPEGNIHQKDTPQEKKGGKWRLWTGPRHQDYEPSVFQISSRRLRVAVYSHPTLPPGATCCWHCSIPYYTALFLWVFFSPFSLPRPCLYFLLLFFLPISSYADHTLYVPEAPGALLDLRSLLLQCSAYDSRYKYPAAPHCDAWNHPHCWTLCLLYTGQMRVCNSPRRIWVFFQHESAHPLLQSWHQVEMLLSLWRF